MPTATHLSLRALRHPFTLASIAILLINDHWLKTAAPSALTGKLSDFAGLFFFPFLLATLLGAARLPARPTFLLALAITGGWFALMKTTLWANALTRAALSAVWDGPTSIVLDPTDCWALVMFFPVWLLWRSLERERTPQPPGKLALAALGVTVLASLATSPPFRPPEVIRLAHDETNIYAYLAGWHGSNTNFVSSQDGGRTWQKAFDVSASISSTLNSQVIYPVITCFPDNSRHCFRLPEAATSVEESLDGGQTWQIAWQIPWGRLSFMQRMKSAGTVIENLLRDLIVLGDSDKFIIIVAAGNEGIVVRRSDEGWERFSVMEARPTLWQVTRLDQAVGATNGELIFLLQLAFGLWLGIGLNVSHRVSRELPKLKSRVDAFINTLVVFSIVGGLLFLIAIGLAQPYYDSLSLLFLPFSLLCFLAVAFPAIWLAIIFGLLFLLIGWANIVTVSPNPAAAKKLGWLVTSLALGLLLLGWLPFALWAFGVIPIYEMALAFSAALIAFLLWRAWPKIISLRQQALTPPAV